MSTLTQIGKISEVELIEQLGWRYATKRFDSNRKISSSNWETIKKAIVLSPSSYGLQPWKAIVVQNSEVRKKLTPASWNQPQVEEASHFVVFASKTDMDENYIKYFIHRTAELRGIPAETLSSYENMMIGDLVKGPRHQIVGHWAARQAYIALGNLLTSAALLGIDACPMEGFDPIQYNQILKLEGTGYQAVVACALGYRSDQDAYQNYKKVRLEEKILIQHL